MHRVSSSFERMSLRSPMHCRGGPWKIGHGLQHSSAIVGLKGLFQFILLLQSNIMMLANYQLIADMDIVISPS
jgi:hypothetical protein